MVNIVCLLETLVKTGDNEGDTFGTKWHTKGGNELLEFALSVIYNIQYEIGGMVVFLESEEKEKLMKLYETNNSFKRFAVRENKENVKLIQLLKIL